MVLLRLVGRFDAAMPKHSAGVEAFDVQGVGLDLEVNGGDPNGARYCKALNSLRVFLATRCSSGSVLSLADVTQVNKWPSRAMSKLLAAPRLREFNRSH